jgi:hypothetical protein
MQKEELIHLHILMVHIKKFCESISNNEIPSERYKSLDISPFHLHKEKNAHKIALLTLSDEIVTHLHKQSMQVINFPSDNASIKAAAED